MRDKSAHVFPGAAVTYNLRSFS